MIHVFVDLQLEQLEVELAAVSSNSGITDLHLTLGSGGARIHLKVRFLRVLSLDFRIRD